MAPVVSPAEPGRVGPHPSYIEIAKPYILQSRIQKCLNDIHMSDAKEDAVRLQGVAWIDQVRRALQLPIRTFNTAVIYYHKFRLLHSDNEYNWADASAAALFTACKIEDTLKKSREILCANWNLKVGPGESLSSDDPRFDNHSKLIIGLERLMLESAGFDFRNRYPQKLMVKLARALKFDRHNVSRTAWNLSIDLYKTFAPLKQTTPTLAIACLELAARLHDMDTARLIDVGVMKYSRWATSRAEVMETLLDLLDLYTHHRGSTSVGPLYTLEAFLNIRIGLNQEASAANIPRYALYASDATSDGPHGTNGLKLKNGIGPTSPLTPATPGTISPGNAQPPTSAIGIRGQNGTVRFMLDAARARDEHNEVDKFHRIEEEEYEVEVPNDVRLDDRDKRSRDSYSYPTPREEGCVNELVGQATKTSYWDKFRQRHDPPELASHIDYPTLHGNCHDLIDHHGDYEMADAVTPAELKETLGGGFRKPLPTKRGVMQRQPSYDWYKARRPSTSSYGRSDIIGRSGNTGDDHGYRSPERRKRIGIQAGGVRGGRPGFSTTGGYNHSPRRSSVSSGGEPQIDFADLGDLYDSRHTLVSSVAPQVDYADLKGLYSSPPVSSRDVYRPHDGEIDSYRPSKVGGSLKRRANSLSTTPEATGFVHPDRARLMSPEQERPNAKRQKNKKSKKVTGANKGQIWTHNSQPGPMDMSAKQEESDLKLLLCPADPPFTQVPPDRESTGLSAEDGHQWVRESGTNGRGRGTGRGRVSRVRDNQRGSRGRGRGGIDRYRSSATPAPYVRSPRSHRPVGRIKRERRNE